MIVRSLVLALAVAIAPIQCGKSYDPELSKDETPGDALWQLAHRFREEHDEAAARRTLEYLVERYPASRWAVTAREELDRVGSGGGDGGAG
jgi:TolA-binding protein